MGRVPESTPPPSQADIERQACAALDLLLGGDLESGLALYLECAASRFAAAVPWGAHIERLGHGGQGDAAAMLCGLALDRGTDIARRGRTLNGDPIDPVREYETLFAQGAINPRMILAYLTDLSRIGGTDRVARIFDLGRLLRVVRLDPGLADVARDLLLGEESESGFHTQSQSLRNMCRIGEVERMGGPLVAALQQAGQRYLADWAASDHPFARLLPTHTTMKAWGLISRGEGFNTPHYHHLGWATGVYYPIGVKLPGGELCVGRPDHIAASVPGWPEARIRPEAGMLVLMPSFYTHWTVPLGRPGLRLAVAFDMMPAG
jgi:hypothetical protein